METNKTKIVFWGTPDFSLPSLQACLDYGEVIAVVCQPDRPRGRGQKTSPCPVKELALKNKIEIFSPEKLGASGGQEAESLFDFLKVESPDLCLVTAYGNIIPDRFLALTKGGYFNVHASLLPRWRGAAPIQRAIEAGDSETGVCLQKMVSELDAGDIVYESKIEIKETDTSLSLFDALSKKGYDLIAQFVQDYSCKRTPKPHPQDSSKATYAKKISKEEGFWSSDWTALDIHRKVRAFIAWPGVRASLIETGQEFLIESVSLISNVPNAQVVEKVRPGEIVTFDKKAILACQVRASEFKPNFVDLVRIKIPGRSPIAGYDYFQNEFKRLQKTSLHCQKPEKRNES
jgi:methionyl-tRNA formyltransferase